MSKILTSESLAVEAQLTNSRSRLSGGTSEPQGALVNSPADVEPQGSAWQAGPTWQESLKRAVRSGRELLALVGLPQELADARSEADFPVFAPREYIQRMKQGDPQDPLLLQVLGTQQEVLELLGTQNHGSVEGGDGDTAGGDGEGGDGDTACRRGGNELARAQHVGEVTGTQPVVGGAKATQQGLLDPVGDTASTLMPGLLKKYSGRALLITSGACAVHCRYCFRRHYPYSDAPTGPAGWQPAVDRIGSDPTIEEVILSGGDPLSVRDESLKWLIMAIDSIPHVRRIRVHTRFPLMIPQRVCEPLTSWVSGSRCAVYFVLHFNHAAEIDSPVIEAMRKLRAAGASLLNQSVLLRGVNDTFESQRALCDRLIDMNVMPYYLHQLDRVKGALHFEVSDESALHIMNQLRRALPGYAVPKLVREVAGQPHKMPVEF